MANIHVINSASFCWISLCCRCNANVLYEFYYLVTQGYFAGTGTVYHCPHDDVIKWRRFPRYWPFVRGIHWSPVNSPHKGQWRGALMFLWSAPWINGWVNNRETGDLRRHCAHYDVTVMNASGVARWDMVENDRSCTHNKAWVCMMGMIWGMFCTQAGIYWWWDNTERNDYKINTLRYNLNQNAFSFWRKTKLGLYMSWQCHFLWQIFLYWNILNIKSFHKSQCSKIVTYYLMYVYKCLTSYDTLHTVLMWIPILATLLSWATVTTKYRQLGMPCPIQRFY